MTIFLVQNKKKKEKKEKGKKSFKLTALLLQFLEDKHSPSLKGKRPKIKESKEKEKMTFFQIKNTLIIISSNKSDLKKVQYS